MDAEGAPDAAMRSDRRSRSERMSTMAGLFSIVDISVSLSPHATTVDEHINAASTSKRSSVRRIECTVQKSRFAAARAKMRAVGRSRDVSTKEDRSQHNGVVMSFVMRCKNERNPSSLSEGA